MVWEQRGRPQAQGAEIFLVPVLLKSACDFKTTPSKYQSLPATGAGKPCTQWDSRAGMEARPRGGSPAL